MSFNPDIERLQPCEFCKDLDELEKEYPDEIHHGATLYCDECSSEYYEPYGGGYQNVNQQAKRNHPELQTI